MNEEEQIKDEVIKNINKFVKKTIEVKFRDEELLILQTIIKELQKENEKLKLDNQVLRETLYGGNVGE